MWNGLIRLNMIEKNDTYMKASGLTQTQTTHRSEMIL